MSAFIVIIPIVLLFFLMLGLKISGHKSAFITLLVTIAIALFIAPAMILYQKALRLLVWAGLSWKAY